MNSAAFHDRSLFEIARAASSEGTAKFRTNGLVSNRTSHSAARLRNALTAKQQIGTNDVTPVSVASFVLHIFSEEAIVRRQLISILGIAFSAFCGSGPILAKVFILPSTQVQSRCWTGPLVTGKTSDACFGVTPDFSNSLSASDFSPYPINIALTAKAIYGPDYIGSDGSPDYHGTLIADIGGGVSKYVGDDVGSAAFTTAYTGIVLKKDLPAGFGPTITIPVKVDWSKRFSISTDSPSTPVNAAETEAEYQTDFTNGFDHDFYKKIVDDNPAFMETGFVSGDLVQDLLFDTSFNPTQNESLIKTAANMDWAAGVTELNVAGVSLVNSIMFSDSTVYGSSTINLTVPTSIFNLAGDYTTFKTQKGAACLASVFEIVGSISCNLYFDPSFSLNQAQFDADNGASSFNLSDYFQLVTSTGPTAVPELASWAMMIGGLGMAGGLMRRQRGFTIKLALAS